MPILQEIVGTHEGHNIVKTTGSNLSKRSLPDHGRIRQIECQAYSLLVLAPSFLY
jgi:hypothetical protein